MIPNTIGINYQNRTIVAHSQAIHLRPKYRSSWRVRAIQTEFLQPPFEIVPRVYTISLSTTERVSLVGTNQYMPPNSIESQFSDRICKYLLVNQFVIHEAGGSC